MLEKDYTAKLLNLESDADHQGYSPWQDNAAAPAQATLPL